MDASNILKPALSRGEIQLIGATTIGEYRKYIEKDPALERRFLSVIVEEPKPEEAVAILKGLRKAYEDHHKVQITDEAIEAAVTYAVRDAEYNGKQMKKGQILGLAENKVTVVADTRADCLRELLAQEQGLACVTVFYGEEVYDAEAEETQKLLAELLGEDVDLALVPGGQPVYAYLIAVE